MHNRRPFRVPKRAFILIVALLVPATLLAQPGAPCTSQNIACTVTKSFPPTWLNGTWIFSWGWQIAYDCSDQSRPVCKVCSQVEVDYWSKVTNGWIMQSIFSSPSTSAGCNTSNITSYVSSYPTTGIIKFGTTYRATWQCASFDPGLSPNCQGQVYIDYVFVVFTPAEPPLGQ